MKTGEREVLTWAIRSALLSGIGIALATPALAAESPAPKKSDEVIEKIIVTAQKIEESLQDVPIAVSAFTGDALEKRQITQSSDLQFNVPNVTFTKTNFTGTNFQIRGIGASLIGASADSGVESHFNSVPLAHPRLFETEFFDVERIEVLRGPQGTLYGRNATGGAINVIAKRPTHEFGTDIEAEYGNYDSKKVKAAVNLPIGDVFAMRFSGIYLKRDGFTKNLFTGNDIDDRDQYSARAGFRLTPSEGTDINLTLNYFKEDDHRARVTKQLCHHDPSGNYGCLPDYLTNQAFNARASLGGVAAEFYAIGTPFALNTPGTDAFRSSYVPKSLHLTYADFDPTYKADEKLATLEIEHDFGAIKLTAVTGYQTTTFEGMTDYEWTVAAANYNGPALGTLYAPTGGLVPISQIEPSLTGSFGGHVFGAFARSYNYDLSQQDAKQWSQEVRINSSFDGAFNFLLGAFYFDSKDDETYSIAANSLDYAAALTSLRPPIYTNDTPEAPLKSTALFGEAYYKMSDAFKWTLGLRYTRDKKGIRDRQLLLSDPATAAFNPFRTDDTTFSKVTGRFGFDWKPHLGFTDDSTIYAFYSRGYKAGGFNPPLDRSLPQFAGTPETYNPESVNAFEVGWKNTAWNGRAQFNLTGFYYDYKDLQVSKIIARTSVNENIDANIYGFEAEFVLSPVENLLFNLNLSNLNTKIKDAAIVDPRDPTNGNPALTLVKDVVDASNCTVPTANVAAARTAGAILPAQLGGPFGVCSALAAFGASDGEAANLDGNQLQNAPRWNISTGVQYAITLPAGFHITPRLDYYWRSKFYGRIFDKPIDTIKPWAIMNAQITLDSPDNKWYIRANAHNLTNREAITGMYLTDPSSGLFTNVFALDPRTYTLAVGVHF